MKPSKTFLNKELDKQLLPRLRYMGFILIVFGVLSLGYAIFSTPYLSLIEEQPVSHGIEQSAGIPDLNDGPPLMITKEQKISIYMIAAAFEIIGAACIVIAWKKLKTAALSPAEPEEAIVPEANEEN